MYRSLENSQDLESCRDVFCRAAKQTFSCKNPLRYSRKRGKQSAPLQKNGSRPPAPTRGTGGASGQSFAATVLRSLVGSFSAVSKPTFVNEMLSVYSIFWYLWDLRIFAPLPDSKCSHHVLLFHQKFDNSLSNVAKIDRVLINVGQLFAECLPNFAKFWHVDYVLCFLTDYPTSDFFWQLLRQTDKAPTTFLLSSTTDRVPCSHFWFK